MSSHNSAHSVYDVLCIPRPDVVAQGDGGGLQGAADRNDPHVDFGRKRRGDQEVFPWFEIYV